MRQYPFYKFSPSGNTTLFVEDDYPGHDNPHAVARLCGKALLVVDAEQCGLCEPRAASLHMAGGEFCANACRAFGALMDLANASHPKNTSRHYEMTSTGTESPVFLEVTGQCPVWHTRAAFQFPEVDIRPCGSGATLARLPGISHLLLEAASFPESGQARKLGSRLIQEYRLDYFAACGIIWWQRARDGMRILPLVHVPATGSTILESACGSASIALACALAQPEGQTLKIIQPSGAILGVKMADSKIFLSGDVTLLASGTLWLDEGSCQ